METSNGMEGLKNARNASNPKMVSGTHGLSALESDARTHLVAGLSANEAASRVRKDGLNRLPGNAPKSLWAILRTPERSLTSGKILSGLPTHTTHEHREPVVLTPASKNRYLSTIRRILTLCEEWKWVHKAPKLRKFEKSDVRVRWEPPTVITKFFQKISADWLRDVCVFAVVTGMRANEILSLRWSQVDIAQGNAWVTHSGAKSKRARAVPLNVDAIGVLQSRKGVHVDLAFTRSPRPGREVAQISQIDADMSQRVCVASIWKIFTFTTCATLGPYATFRPEHR